MEGLLGALFLLALYLIPTIVGILRSLTNIGTVVVINVLLGWTGIGWIIALAMAFGASTRDVVNVKQVS